MRGDEKGGSCEDDTVAMNRDGICLDDVSSSMIDQISDCGSGCKCDTLSHTWT